MRRNVAPYGAGASTFNASPMGNVPFATVSNPGTLSVPFPMSTGPGYPYSQPGPLGFPVDGQYSSQNGIGQAANNTVPHHLVVRPNKADDVSINNIKNLGEAMLCFVRNPAGAPRRAAVASGAARRPAGVAKKKKKK